MPEGAVKVEGEAVAKETDVGLEGKQEGCEAVEDGVSGLQSGGGGGVKKEDVGGEEKKGVEGGCDDKKGGSGAGLEQGVEEGAPWGVWRAGRGGIEVVGTVHWEAEVVRGRNGGSRGVVVAVVVGKIGGVKATAGGGEGVVWGGLLRGARAGPGSWSERHDAECLPGKVSGWEWMED